MTNKLEYEEQVGKLVAMTFPTGELVHMTLKEVVVEDKIAGEIPETVRSEPFTLVFEGPEGLDIEGCGAGVCVEALWPSEQHGQLWLDYDDDYSCRYTANFN